MKVNLYKKDIRKILDVLRNSDINKDILDYFLDDLIYFYGKELEEINKQNEQYEDEYQDDYVETTDIKRNIFTFKKDDIAPYVIGVQFRWQFDPNSDTYQETYQIDPESINVIHIIDRDGKVIDPFTEAWMTSLEELDDDLFYIGENEHPIHESEYGKCEFDIVKVFNLAQTLSSVHSEPICIYDRTGQDKIE